MLPMPLSNLKRFWKSLTPVIPQEAIKSKPRFFSHYYCPFQISLLEFEKKNHQDTRPRNLIAYFRSFLGSGRLI